MTRRVIRWGGTQEEFWKWSELPIFREISMFGSTLTFTTYSGQTLRVERGEHVSYVDGVFEIIKPEEIRRRRR